jgi:thymidylate synthase
MAQYAVLLHLVAQFTGLVPDEFVHVLADAHIYRDHMDAVRQQLARVPYPSPRLALDPSLASLDDVVARYREIVARARAGEKPGPLLDAIARLEQYQFHPPIEAKMAV